MSELTLDKITLKGHASFYLRDGWLSKGLEVDDPQVFRDTLTGTNVLGVGSVMVKAIRYYLTAAGLKRHINLDNEEFGDLVLAYDPYFEQLTTRYLVHYFLTINTERATSWYLFFNYCNFDGMTKEDVSEFMKSLIREAKPGAKFSAKSVEDDVNCIINTYVPKEFTHDITPEDNYLSPLAELGLLDMDASNRLVKSQPRFEQLSKNLVLFVMCGACEKANVDEGFLFQTSVDKLMSEPGNVGKVFNLSRAMIYNYLEQLQAEGKLTIHKTAGLDQVYIRETISLEELLKNG